MPPKSWPTLWWALRHIRDLGNSIALWPQESYEADFIARQFRGKTAVVVNHPEAVKHVLVTTSSNYPKSAEAQAVLTPLLGKGLLSAEGEDWQRQRRIASPAFQQNRIMHFVPLMTEATADALARWDTAVEGATVDVAEEMRRLTLSIIARAMFGNDLDEEIDAICDTLTRWLRLFESRALMTNVAHQILGLPLHWARALSARVIRPPIKPLDRHAHALVARPRARGKEVGDYLSMLMRAQEAETGPRVTAQDVRDQIATILFTGHETPANALTWTWYLVGLHPWAEEKLHAELDRVLGGRAPAADDIPRLVYTRMVIEESMRLYPPGFVMIREAVKDDEIGGNIIPKGSRVFVSPWLIHRHRKLWDDPDYFDPERFSSERSANRHKLAYLPFGAGPRICIGAGFAMTEAIAILAMVAQRFRLRLKPRHPVEPVAGIVLRPRYGMPMRLERR